MPRTTAGSATAVQFAALAVTWGASFLLIKIGLQGLSPAQVVLARLLAGAAALLLVTAVTRARLPGLGPAWGHLAVVSVLLCVLPFLLFAWAEQRLPSGLASIYNATTPLMTTIVALAALPDERPTRVTAAGLLTGFAGVLVVLGPWHAAAGVRGGEGLASAACLLATLSYGTAFVYLRRYVSPLRLGAIPAATVQVTLGAGIMLALTPVVGRTPPQLTGPVVASMAALGVLGTGLAYVWNTGVVAGWGATRASTVTYLTPVVGVLLGITVRDEALAWDQPVGAVLVVLGIAVGQQRIGFPRRQGPRS